MLYCDKGSFFNGNPVEDIILSCCANKNSCNWSVVSACFLLNPINIPHFLQILITVVVSFHVLLNLFPQFSFYFWVLCYQVNHCHQVMGSCVSACNEKGAKLFKYFFFCITLLLLLFGVFFLCLSLQLIHN